MSKAHVDPEELRRFSKDLARFNTELEQLVTGLNGRMRHLESTWKDNEQKKFAEQFGGTVRVLGQFLEVSRQHVTTLGKKAQLVEEYLHTR